MAAYLTDSSPRHVRCYDNGGETIDRYTVVFTGKRARMDGGTGRPFAYPYLAMNARPFHPQGFGQHGETNWFPADGLRPPSIGRRGHLGKRIAFAELPDDCRALVLSDYREIWN